MCGIFGLVGKKLTKRMFQEYTDSLFKLTEPRGRQASGISIAANDRLTAFKRPLTASRVIESVEYKKFLDSSLADNFDGNISAIGHCRLVTDGSELKSFHNQPIVLEKLVGVHNGVINNFERIRDREALNTEGIGDSEVLFRYLEKKMSAGKNPVQALQEIHSEIRGAASLGILFSEIRSLIISTNFGSLYISEINEDLFVFASEEQVLNSFQKAFTIERPVKKLEPGIGLIIDTQNLTQQKFNLNKELDKEIKFTKFQANIMDLSPNPKNIKRCTKCILPENYPFLTFDKNGVCSICQKYQKQKYHGKEELEKFLSKYRSKNGEVDCVIGLSGGRDSSYGLHVLKEEFGMNPVGFSYDWLLTSRKARHNIAKMAGALGVEVIYRCGDYQTQAKNIRDNIYGFLKDPDLGMMTFVQAGDKEMYHYGRKIRKEKNQKLTVWCSGYQLEQREFFIGYCGIDKTLINNPRLYDYGWITKFRLAVYYGMKTIKNPSYWNRSIWDNFMAFWHCFVAKDDFLYLFNYYPWNEEEVERTLKEKYEWEADLDYGVNQWRMDDFHTAFINYVYYTVGGFSEFDDFRSNQVREGLITRDEALRLTAIDNNIRYESLMEFSNLVGFNLEHVLKEIDAIPKLYRY